MASPGEGDRESVKDGAVDLNRPETAGPNRVYKVQIWKWALLQDWHWLVQPENPKCIETTENSRLWPSRIFSMVN
jgi:hypothetical protein